jgi:hypothetical protein
MNKENHMNQLLTTPGRFIVGCNYWASHAGTATWSDWRPSVVEEDFRQLSEAGLQVLRVFPLWPDFQPITLLRGGAGTPREYRLGEDPLPDTEAGQAGLSEEMLDRFGVMADLAQKYQLRLVVGLLTGWMSGRLFVPPALEGLNVLTDPAALMWETRFVRHFVRRFKQHPAIEAWDLGNECNVMASVPSPEAAWAWVSAITSAIRAEDPDRPIVSGMHGSLDNWSPQTLGELTDLLTTHPYPVWTQYADQDPVNTIRTILHSSAESRFYADTGGKPCLAEELGTLGPMLASDQIAADFVRSCLYSLWAQDCHGLVWWCAYDQEHLPHAPYDWNTCERELGLIRSDRTLKPVIEELGSFRRWLEGLPIERLPVRAPDAVCLLTLDTDQWAIAYSSFILARQAGFDIEFQQGEQPLKDSSLYLVPSVSGINVITRHRWLELLERVRQGATLYLSLDTALLSGFRETFGLEIQVRQRRPGPMEISLADGTTLRLPAAFRLDLQPTGAEVLAREPDGNPALTRCAYGQGQIYFLSAPIERALAETPGGFHTPEAQPFWQIYREIAAPQIARRAVRKEHPMLGLTEHPLSENERVVIAVNYSPQRLETGITLTGGWQVGDSWRGPALDGQAPTLSIPPNDAAVFVIHAP